MAVIKLDFAEPFYSIEYVEDEREYLVAEKSMAINLAVYEDTPLLIRGAAIAPLKAAVVQNVAIRNAKRVLVIRDFERCDLTDEETVKRIKATWKTLYEMSGIERHKGLPYYKSPKFCLGEGRRHMELNLCFVSEGGVPSGPHKTHDRDFDEVHAQISGFGKMRVFEENDYATMYRELPMSPGSVHDKIYDADGEYPWHEYMSITPCVYCPIELDR